jgi:hypothetical protein
MDLVIFEENKPFVLQSLGNGDFDYIESASEVYPTPRKKEDVPLWFYISSNLSMPFLWWFAQEGCSTLLDLKQA